MIGKPASPGIAGFDLEAIDEINHVVEPATGAGSNAVASNGDRKMGFAGEVPPTSTALRSGQECAASEIAHEGFVDRRALELKAVAVLIERQLGDAELVSRSPMIRSGSCWRLTPVAMISSKAAFMP